MTEKKKKKEPWWVACYGRPTELVWRGARFIWRPEDRNDGSFQRVARFAGGEVYLWPSSERLRDHWDNAASWKNWTAQFNSDFVDQVTVVGKTPEDALEKLRAAVLDHLGNIVKEFQ